VASCHVVKVLKSRASTVHKPARGGVKQGTRSRPIQTDPHLQSEQPPEVSKPNPLKNIANSAAH
jgi:hypothetical protein